MTLETFLLAYGYFAVFVGTLLEGDATLLAAGYLVRRGYLELGSVLLIAALGALVKDQIIFGVGRLGGESILLHRPKWYRRVIKIRRLLRRHHVLMAFSFRFLPVVAMATPLAWGIGRMSYKRFIVLDLVGVFIWVTIVGLVGVAIGQTVEWIIADAKQYEIVLLLVFAIAGLVGWLFRIRSAARNAEKNL